jgi:ubiquinone/menaquinone biosynthesis C-methylase UbiE
MITEKKLLSYRFSRSSFKNKHKYKKNHSNQKILETKCHDFCPICGSKHADLIAEVDRSGFICDTVICQQCYFAFNDTFILNPKDLYLKDYAVRHWSNPEESFKRRTNFDSFAWKRMAFVISKLGDDFGNINSVFELGCGDGCNLLPYHLIGKQASGCDFNEDFLKPGIEKGLNLISGEMQNIPKDKFFDLFLLIHVFGQVIDLDKTIQSISKHLSKEGLVYIEVPGVMGWNRENINKKKSMGLTSSNNFLNYLQFEHNYHFDLAHLKEVWERNGFEMVDGDEWCRAIFRKKFSNEDAINRTINTDKFTNNAYLYLTKVEKDFLNLKNVFYGFSRVVMRKIRRFI